MNNICFLSVWNVTPECVYFLVMKSCFSLKYPEIWGMFDVGIMKQMMFLNCQNLKHLENLSAVYFAIAVFFIKLWVGRVCSETEITAYWHFQIMIFILLIGCFWIGVKLNLTWILKGKNANLTTLTKGYYSPSFFDVFKVLAFTLFLFHRCLGERQTCTTVHRSLMPYGFNKVEIEGISSTIILTQNALSIWLFL